MRKLFWLGLVMVAFFNTSGTAVIASSSILDNEILNVCVKAKNLMATACKNTNSDIRIVREITYVLDSPDSPNSGGYDAFIQSLRSRADKKAEDKCRTMGGLPVSTQSDFTSDYDPYYLNGTYKGTSYIACQFTKSK